MYFVYFLVYAYNMIGLDVNIMRIFFDEPSVHVFNIMYIVYIEYNIDDTENESRTPMRVPVLSSKKH